MNSRQSVLLSLLAMAGSVRAEPAAAPIETVEVGPHGEFRVNGEPFFPLCSWLQGVTTYNRLKGLGFNVFIGNWQAKPPAAEMGDLALKAGGYAVPHFDGTGIAHPGVFGWMDVDEPDITRIVHETKVTPGEGLNVLKSAARGEVRRTPAQSLAKYHEMKAGDPSRPVFLTLTSRFLERYEGWHKVPRDEMRAMYPEWAKAADVLGFDIYPIYGFNKPEWLLDNIAGVKRLRELAGPGKPLYVWIETCDGGAQQRDDMKVLPRHTRAQVWMSVVAGARAIGYFTHAFKPRVVPFAPDTEMQAELKRLNTQITRLAPELLAQPADDRVSIAFEGGIEGHCMATEKDGSLLIVAQNLDVAGRDGLGGRTGKARIAVAGLKAGTAVEVVDEDRVITAQDGGFEDTFEALAEHIYRIAR